ncbi:MAG: putative endonuclease [Thermomicrobiales bacterium]|nr:putative endonuclease [Thermomicrobiales bacterium]
MSATPRTRLGRSGEGLARAYLERQGFVFLAANWRCRLGELDLVMRDGDDLVFVEVKTRHGDEAGRAEEGISAAQAQRILASAEWFLSEHQDLESSIWRVDLVAVTLDGNGAVARLTHWPDAVVTG